MGKQEQLPAILEDLRDPDEKIRTGAFKTLKSRVRRGQLDAVELCTVLSKAPGPWPHPIENESGDEAILRCFYDVELPPSAVSALVKSFAAHGADARRLVMNVLGRSGAPSNLEGYLEVVRRHARTGELAELASYVVRTSDPVVFGKLFPELLDYLNVEALASEICHMAFDAVREGGMSKSLLIPYVGDLLSILTILRKDIAPLQQESGIAWMWAREYEDKRNLAGLLLDLVADLPESQVVGELTAWLEMQDPRLLAFATVSLLAFGRKVDSDVIRRCVVLPEMRTIFYDRLAQIGQQGLYPTEFFNQVHFAESDMVRWLTYPTELNRAPDEIVPAQVLRFRMDGYKPVALYVFRYRTHEPDENAEDGWMAGISGPFALDGVPSTEALGGTFSDFEPWESRSAADHAIAIAAITIGELPDFEILEPGQESI